MSIITWLKIGIIMLISLTVEEIEVDDTSISALVQAETLITKEMHGLIEHGVTIEFELYNSLLLKGINGESLLRKWIIRTVSYDYYREQYKVLTYFLNGDADESIIEQYYYQVKEFDKAAADFGRIEFVINSQNFNKISWFSQLSLLPNRIIEEELGQNTESLWDNHRPSVTVDIKR